MQDLSALTHQILKVSIETLSRLMVGPLSTYSFMMTMSVPLNLTMPTNDSPYFFITTRQKEAIQSVAQ